MDRTFSNREMARIACSACEGCGACCKGMGESILLDPYDAAELAAALNRPFVSMLNQEVELILDRGMILPHISMRAETDACSFLGEDGRCSIHAHRPGICRLFPLGRNYEEDKMTYFILENACDKPGKTKVRISKYLGIPNIDTYETYKIEWHAFVTKIQERLEHETDEGEVKRINMFLLKTFFMNPYGEDFYADFESRMETVRRMF